MIHQSTFFVVMKKMGKILSALLLVVSSMTPTFAHESHSTESLEGYVGTVEFKNSCGTDVKERINRGLALLHHMMYGASEKTFRAVAQADPDCAMAHWGIAMTLFHPLWAPPSNAELTKGWNAVQQAVALNPPTAREKEYVRAAEDFYKDWGTVNHKTRIVRWEAAQEKLYQGHPNDIEAGAFYALAQLATAPKGDKTFSHQKTAGALLETLHANAPEHPGLFHYIIHAYDNPMLASRAVTVARDYLKLAPQIPHALHMPSHIFVRLGLWSDVIEWNRLSADVANHLSTGRPVSLHAIHAMDYLMYAYLQQANDAKAREVLTEVNGSEAYQDSFASAYGIAAAQARYALERQQWVDAAELPIRMHQAFPWEKYAWYESITYFARGLGAALEAYKTSLKTSPNRLNSLYGAGRAAEEVDDRDAAGLYYTQLMNLATDGEPERSHFKRAKAFLLHK